MSQPRKAAKGIVLQLKDALSKDLMKIQKYSSDSANSIALSTSFYDRVLDVFRQLDELQIDLSILSDTLIGTTVSKFKKCEEAEVVEKAKELIRKWKKIAKDAGMSSTSGSKQQAASTIARQSSTPKASSNEKKRSDKLLNQKSPQNSGSKLTTKIPEKWQELSSLRQNVCKKIKILLETNMLEMSPVSDDQVVDIVTNIESSINGFSKGNRQVYAEKARSINFNLKKNANLCQRLLSGNIKPQRLVSMSVQEMATTEKAKQREDVIKKTQDARRLDWDEQNEAKINEMCGIKGELLQASLFTCGRCKSIKTTSTQKQTRSADEPMTVFVYCQNCGNRWKC